MVPPPLIVKLADVAEFEAFGPGAKRYAYRDGEPRQRQNLDCMGEGEIDRLRRAFRTLYDIDHKVEDRRNFNNQALIHQNHCQHGWERFLTWHRAYLYEFEQNLQDFDRDIMLPYWDWTMPQYRPNDPTNGSIIPASFKAFLTPAAAEAMIATLDPKPTRAQADAFKALAKGPTVFVSQHEFFCAVITKVGYTAVAAAAKTGRALFNVSAVGELLSGHAPAKPSASSHISEIDQAFTGPLFDQNGNPTFYEILLDNHEVGYLCANKLYSIAGQIDFSSDPNNKVQFPAGQWQTNGSGAFELKLAWRILDPKKDKADRFYHQPAQVLIENQWTSVEVGLVGMHIAHKSQSSPQWIWSTFEQVDNLATDQVANPGLNPSYFNPNCPTCLVNVQPVGSNPANHPTQALRMIPIPPDKQELNREAQAALHAQNSVWQYYQLIDTQWPTNPSAPPISPGDTNLPQSIDNKSGGDQTPVYLTNITMETYFQVGNQSATLQQEGNPPSTVQVFGTESCTGCHSSAGIATSGTAQKPVYSGQLTADFSWLMQIKAQ
jgi:hypothetical protein